MTDLAPDPFLALVERPEATHDTNVTLRGHCESLACFVWAASETVNFLS